MLLNARQLVTEAAMIAIEQGLTQAEWCRRAGYDEFGKLISNSRARGDCKLSVMTQLLKPLGCRLIIVKDGEKKMCCPFDECVLEKLKVFQDL